MKSLLEDPAALPVVEDLMREVEGAVGPMPFKRSAAHMRWLEHVKDTDGERDRTMFVVDSSTTFESYPEKRANDSDWIRRWRGAADREGSWSFWFPVARAVLQEHPGAVRVRVVVPDGHYRAAAGEVVLVRRKRRSDRKLWVDTYCAVSTCNHDLPLLAHIVEVRNSPSISKAPEGT